MAGALVVDMDQFDDIDLEVFHRSIERGNVQFFDFGMKKDPKRVNLSNEKGETALHIACKHPNGSAFINRILSETSNVNANNYWKQTPLHYAATSKSITTLKLLLSQQGINVHCKDVNGYTALHEFIMSSQTFDDEMRKGLKLLVGAKIDINARTNYGQSIMHLASFAEDNTDIICHMLRTYPGIDLEARNIYGENFLHIYGMIEIGRYCMEVFEEMNKINKPVLQKLLSQQDMSGSTPWLLMVENGELSFEDFERMIKEYSLPVTFTDNLGNTALHRRVGKGGAELEHHLKICSLLVKRGVNVNGLNVFGQSAGSLSFYEEVFDMLRVNKLDFTKPDRWGRIPIFYLLQKTTNPDILQAMLQKNPWMVNTKDSFGATPLHYAAYGGLIEHMQVLLNFNADLNARDALGKTPLDSARRHGNIDCFKTLASAMKRPYDKEVLIYKSQDVTLDLSSLYQCNHIGDLLTGFPKDIENFAKRALEFHYKTGTTNDTNSDVSEIVRAVNEHVQQICKLVSGYDSRFRLSVFPTGSSAEGTKIGPPDEFDFVLCIESLSAMCDIETFEFGEHGYAYLRFKDNPVPDMYASFSDCDRCFLALPFLHYLFRYIRRALSEKQLWVNGNLYSKSDEKIHVIFNKPVFNYDLYWVGSRETNLKISIDLVPAVYQRGWWPNHTRFEAMKLINKTVRDAGCFVLMQTKENSFNRGWVNMNDSISLTCNPANTEGTYRRLLLSVAPAEIALMRSLPERYRKGYALAKIAKSDSICPDVRIDIKPPIIDTVIYDRFRNESGEFKTRAFVSPPKEIKSYWLKNCIFYLAEERLSRPVEAETPLEITVAAYRKLYNFALQWNFRPYILHTYDLFKSQDYTIGQYGFTIFIARRKVYIETVLAVLGQDLPKQEDFMSWIKECQMHYKSC